LKKTDGTFGRCGWGAKGTSNNKLNQLGSAWFPRQVFSPTVQHLTTHRRVRPGENLAQKRRALGHCVEEISLGFPRLEKEETGDYTSRSEIKEG
jgi:hypothetical protein